MLNAWEELRSKLEGTNKATIRIISTLNSLIKEVPRIDLKIEQQIDKNKELKVKARASMMVILHWLYTQNAY